MSASADLARPDIPQPESVFTWGAPPLKFGAGALDELGHDVAALGARHVLVLTDPGVAACGLAERAVESLRRSGLQVHLYDQAGVEPTDESLRQAISAARQSAPRGGWDALVAVGGGSSIDTAKAVNLMLVSSGDLMDHVNAPVGGGRPPDGPLLPLVAVPTTAGTGSESTPVCVLDILGLHVKSGISHPALRPVLAVVDPELTLSLPPEVTASAGMDIVCHALESWTARPWTSYERRPPERRVAYNGANPVSDVWAERALGLVARSFRGAVHSGDDLSARTDMALAATFAGMGFGNAGVHIPHACAYPIAGRVRAYHPQGYPAGAPMVPHGQSVSLTAPSAFRLTFDSAPGRHVRAARLLEPAEPEPGSDAEARQALPNALVRLMQAIGIPAGLAAVGFDEADVPALVEGALQQKRLLAVAPVPVDGEALAGVLGSSMENW